MQLIKILTFEGRGDKNGYWLHSAGNVNDVVYKTYKKRGGEAINSFFISQNFEGIAVHDHWKHRE